MTVVLASGIRKNGATRICLPRPPSVMEAVPLLTGEPQPMPCRGFNRPWMRPSTVQRTLAIWTACPSHTEAHQLACRLILGLQAGVIEVVAHKE